MSNVCQNRRLVDHHLYTGIQKRPYRLVVVKFKFVTDSVAYWVREMLFCRCRLNFVKWKENCNYLFFGTHYSYLVRRLFFCLSGVSVCGSYFWLLSVGCWVVTVDCRTPMSVIFGYRLSVWLLTIGVGCRPLFPLSVPSSDYKITTSVWKDFHECPSKIWCKVDLHFRNFYK